MQGADASAPPSEAELLRKQNAMPWDFFCGLGGEGSYALTTLPLRRQDAQTRIRFPWPATLACTGRKLMFQRRLVTLWAWLMRFPACGFLPQISHCCAMDCSREFQIL